MKSHRLFSLLLPWIFIFSGLAPEAGHLLAAKPSGQAVALAGENVSVDVGSVTLTTYSPLVIPGIEYTTNIYFIARNNGSQRVTLIFTSLQEIANNNKDWMFHFFAFFPVDPEGVGLNPGQEATLEFLLTNEGEANVTLPFRFRIKETGEQGTFSLNVVSSSSPSFRDLPLNATVKGRIMTATGQPAASADVRLYFYNGRDSLNATTDSQGNYSITCPAIEEIEAVFGSRPLPYHTLGYFLLVDKEGYSLGYEGNIKPSRGGTVTADLGSTGSIFALTRKSGS